MKYLRIHIVFPPQWSTAQEKVEQLKKYFEPYFKLDISLSYDRADLPVVRHDSGSAWYTGVYENYKNHVLDDKDYPAVDILCLISEHAPETNWGIRRDTKNGTANIQIYVKEDSTRPIMNSNPPEREEVFVPYVAHEMCHAMFDLFGIPDPQDGSTHTVHWFDYVRKDLREAIMYAYKNHDTRYVLNKILYFSRNKPLLYMLITIIHKYLK